MSEKQLPKREKNKVKEINLLRTSKHRRMLKSMITHVLNRCGIQREREPQGKGMYQKIFGNFVTSFLASAIADLH